MKPTGLRTYAKTQQEITSHTGRKLSPEDIACMERSEVIARAWLDARGVRHCRRRRGFAPWKIPGAAPPSSADLHHWKLGLSVDLHCDHEELFVTPDGTPAIVVGHLYAPMDENRLRALAERYGLRLTVGAAASWYFPDRATLVEFGSLLLPPPKPIEEPPMAARGKRPRALHALRAGLDAGAASLPVNPPFIRNPTVVDPAAARVELRELARNILFDYEDGEAVPPDKTVRLAELCVALKVGE